MNNPVISINMRSGGVMTLELFPARAPITVDNFISLALCGYYNGLSFHRVVKGFVIQGGSKSNTCAGEETGFTIKGEFAQNGVDTGLNHERGALSMARGEHPDSAATQFFIVHEDAHRLDGKYAAFGKLLTGFEVLDQIAAEPTRPASEENRPLTPQMIESVTVELNGYAPSLPQRIRTQGADKEKNSDPRRSKT